MIPHIWRNPVPHVTQPLSAQTSPQSRKSTVVESVPPLKNKTKKDPVDTHTKAHLKTTNVLAQSFRPNGCIRANRISASRWNAVRRSLALRHEDDCEFFSPGQPPTDPPLTYISLHLYLNRSRKMVVPVVAIRKPRAPSVSRFFLWGWREEGKTVEAPSKQKTGCSADQNPCLVIKLTADIPVNAFSKKGKKRQ